MLARVALRRTTLSEPLQDRDAPRQSLPAAERACRSSASPWGKRPMRAEPNGATRRLEPPCPPRYPTMLRTSFLAAALVGSLAAELRAQDGVTRAPVPEWVVPVEVPPARERAPALEYLLIDFQ